MSDMVVRIREDRARLLRDMGMAATDIKSYDVEIEGVGYSVAVSRDVLVGTEDDWRWHVSVAGQQLPTWAHFAAIVHRVRPGVVFCMALPPRWINVHENCLHAWEVGDAHLQEQWRHERKGDTPT